LVKICWLGNVGGYGAGIYNRMVVEVLSEHFDLEFFKLKPNIVLGYAEVASLTKKLDEKYDVVIRSFHGVIPAIQTMNKAKNIAILQFAPNRMGIKKPVSILDEIFYRNVKKMEMVITVSNFLRNMLNEKGCDNVEVIYNAFEVDKFQNISYEELERFKANSGLTDKPVVYIGNCRKEKGVVEVYDTLKNLDVHLVSSGKKLVDIPVKNFELSYEEHMLLLKSAKIIITMSKIPEAWNRTAHEGMLCWKPVVGSGTGGLRELLEGGKQIICKDFSKLREIVEELLENKKKRRKLGRTGFEFAKKFTMRKFKKRWIELIDDIM